MSDEQTPERKVGYKNPPVSGQFKPNEIANADGRRGRKRKFTAARDRMLDSPVSATDQKGRKKNLTTTDAALLRLRNTALSDNDRNLGKLLSYAEQREEEEAAKAAMAARRELEERELALLREAWPRLRVKLGMP